MKKFLVFLCVIFLVFGTAAIAGATTLDVYDWDVDQTTPFGTIDTIATAQTGASHYDYFSASGHPSNVNIDTYNSSFWVHENTITGEYTFGFIFSKDASPDASNFAELFFRIVDSTSDVYVSQSDDPGEAVETSPGTFHGDYYYTHNTDGIAVSGITGTGWTIMIDSVDFGDIESWFAASGETADFSDDLTLTLGHQYRIVLEGGDPSGAPITGEVPEPATMLLLGSGLAGLFGFRRKLRKR